MKKQNQTAVHLMAVCVALAAETAPVTHCRPGRKPRGAAKLACGTEATSPSEAVRDRQLLPSSVADAGQRLADDRLLGSIFEAIAPSAGLVDQARHDRILARYEALCEVHKSLERANAHLSPAETS